MNETTEQQVVRLRAEWLHLNNAPKDWLIITQEEIGILDKELLELKSQNAKLKNGLDKISKSSYWWHENGQIKEFSTPDALEARKVLESL